MRVAHGAVSDTTLTVLSLFRRNGSQSGREHCVRGHINRLVLDDSARWIFAEKVVFLPVPRRSDRPGDETAATVGADIAQHPLLSVSSGPRNYGHRSEKIPQEKRLRVSDPRLWPVILREVFCCGYCEVLTALAQ